MNVTTNVTYAGHWSSLLQCRLGCNNKMNVVNASSEPLSDYFVEHYNYLQFAYHKRMYVTLPFNCFLASCVSVHSGLFRCWFVVFKALYFHRICIFIALCIKMRLFSCLLLISLSDTLVMA